MKGFRFSPKVGSITASIGSVFGKNSDDAENEEVLLRDEEGNVLNREDIIRDVMDKLDKRRTERLPLERQWTLNADFLCGNQYCEINLTSGEIEQTEPEYAYVEREVFNNIAPLIETRIANLKKLNYLMKVKPATNELEDYRKAAVSTSLLQYIQKSTDFESKRDTMIYWNELCGNCFFLNWWDKGKGEEYAREKTTVIDNDGNETTEEQAYYYGELDYGLLTPYEVYPESIFKQGIESQRSIIIEQVKSVEEIYELYGIKVKGSNVNTFELTPVVSGGSFGFESTVMSMGHRVVDDAQKVVTYFERPSRHLPGGRMIIVIGEEHIVYYGNLPYGRIPIVQCVCHEVAGQFFGKSTIENLIPLQRAYNKCVNRIHEYIARIALGNFMVEEGSVVDVEEYEENGLEPGGFIVYRKGTSPPIPVPNGALPAEVIQERYNLRSDMEYVAGVSQLMVSGNAPQTNMSGTAISNLMEIDNTRLSLTGDHIRNSVRKLAVLWLEICKRYAKSYRVIKYVGLNDIGKVIAWSKDDINSYDVEFMTENELLMSEEVQEQKFINALNAGFFTDKSGRIPERVKMKAIECMRLSNYSDLMSIGTLHIQAAQREAEFFAEGVIPEVSEFDEHEIHIDEHKRYVLQMEFRLLKMKKPEYAMAFENHIKKHMAIIEEEKRKQLPAMQGQMM